jgi:hypothetical protein
MVIDSKKVNLFDFALEEMREDLTTACFLPKPKIYIFLNGPMPALDPENVILQYAAVSEDGYCLASVNVPAITEKFAFSLLGRDSKFLKEYRNYYPNGYELVQIKDINAPQNVLLLNHIRKVTSDRIREHAEAKLQKGN